MTVETITEACEEALRILEGEPGPPEWVQTEEERQKLIQAGAALRDLHSMVRLREAPTEYDILRQMKEEQASESDTLGVDSDE